MPAVQNRPRPARVAVIRRNPTHCGTGTVRRVNVTLGITSTPGGFKLPVVNRRRGAFKFMFSRADALRVGPGASIMIASGTTQGRRSVRSSHWSP